MKKIGKKSLFLYFFFVMLISIVAVFSVACDSQETELPVIEDVSFSTESIYVEYGDSSLEENIKGYIQNLPQDATVQFEGLFDLAVGEYPITVNISMDGYQTLSLSVVLVIGKATYNFEDIVFNAKDALWTGETIAIPTIEGDLPYYVNVTYTSNPSPIVEEGVYTVIANFTSTNPNIELTKTSMSTTLTVKRQYVVTVNTNGGVGCESEYKVYNGEYLTLPTPEKEDYIFKGWQKDGVSFNVNAPIVENVELEAVWEPIKYTISYELNSQNMSVNNSENPTEYTHLDEEITLKNPVCEGLNFAGWYTDVECTAPIEKIDPQGRKEITVYAKWTPVVYTINYELDGGENNSENPTEFTVFDYVQFNNPTRENYAFMGWYEDSECNNRVIILSERASDITLYAKWEPRKYMIQYYLNGGKNDDRNPKYFTHLDEGEIVLYAPTKAGYVFDGWYTENYFKNIITTIDTDVLKAYNLYAKWIELDVVFTISPIDESTATLIGIKAKSEITKVEIPSEYDGYAITAIGDATNSVMKNSAHVTSVTIPASVSSINANAFKSSGLTEMSIPNTVTSIGNYAFAYNYELSDVNWSTGALSISSYTFLDCKKLTSFEIPNTVTYIGMKSFKGTGLTEIIIPDSVTDIMSEAFENLALTKAVVGKT